MITETTYTYGWARALTNMWHVCKTQSSVQRRGFWLKRHLFLCGLTS
jgi:hypothetical protein